MQLAKRFGLLFAVAVAIIVGASIATSTPTSAQSYGGNSTIIQNASGIYWCTGATAIFKDNSGNVNWNAACPSTAGASQVWINGVAQVSAPVYTAPVTYAAQPVTYAQPQTTTVVVVDPCANNNAYGYASVNPFGFGFNNPLGYGLNYGMSNGCGQNFNAGFNCLSFGCRGFSTFPRACVAPGSCGQGLPPHHDHDSDCVPSSTVHCH
jgi:hypothetical protein